MRRIDGRLVLSPTDLTKLQECHHLTWLHLQVAQGDVAAPANEPDEALDLIFQLGLAHRHRYLETLRADGKEIREIPTAFERRPAWRRGRHRRGDARRSRRRLRGTFFVGAKDGQGDFLIRVEKPSNLGDWSYEIADTNLARQIKVAALLRMVAHAERLAVLNGHEPGRMFVVTGDGEEPFRARTVGRPVR